MEKGSFAPHPLAPPPLPPPPPKKKQKNKKKTKRYNFFLRFPGIKDWLLEISVWVYFHEK